MFFTYHVLYTTVFSFCVFSNGDQINILICCRVTLNWTAWSNICKQVECSRYSKINPSICTIKMSTTQWQNMFRDFMLPFSLFTVLSINHTFLMWGLTRHGLFQSLFPLVLWNDKQSNKLLWPCFWQCHNNSSDLLIPFNPTLFWLIDLITLGETVVFPLGKTIGSTFTSSQVTGTLNLGKHPGWVEALLKLDRGKRSMLYLCCTEDILHSIRNFWTNAMAWHESDFSNLKYKHSTLWIQPSLQSPHAHVKATAQ